MTGSILTVQQRLQAFAKLGEWMKQPGEPLSQLIESAANYNAWFTPENTRRAFLSFGEMLSQEKLEKWFEAEGSQQSAVSSQQSTISSPAYSILNPQPSEIKSIGLVLAGNIPLVGFHDVLCVLVFGNTALIKLSSQDSKLIPSILNQLLLIEPGFASRINYVERLEGYDAVIATGSNNTSRYFDYYFAAVPHIIRKNRNSIAVLTGNETIPQLEALGNDIFDYFGLGCRNVSKLYVPEGYGFDLFFESVEKFNTVANHHKYNNNYDYNKSVYLVNLEKHLDNGFLLLKKDERLVSPLAVLYYEEYNAIGTVIEKLMPLSGQIQCMVSSVHTALPIQHVDFGKTQQPELWDYADSINTMQFLFL